MLFIANLLFHKCFSKTKRVINYMIIHLTTQSQFQSFVICCYSTSVDFARFQVYTIVLCMRQNTWQSQVFRDNNAQIRTKEAALAEKAYYSIGFMLVKFLHFTRHCIYKHRCSINSHWHGLWSLTFTFKDVYSYMQSVVMTISSGLGE